MNLTRKQKDALLNILNYEQSHHPEDLSLGWSWSDVRVAPPTLNGLLLKGLLEKKFHLNSYRGLLLTEVGQEQVTLLTEPTEAREGTVTFHRFVTLHFMMICETCNDANTLSGRRKKW